MTTEKTCFNPLFISTGGDQKVPEGLSSILEQFKRGEYSFQVGQFLSVYDPEKSKDKHYKVHQIDGYGNCLGLTTDAFETIVLQCPGKKPERPGCFDIFTPKSPRQNTTSTPIREVRQQIKNCPFFFNLQLFLAPSTHHSFIHS